MKRKLIAVLIGIVVMVGPFRKAYADYDFDHPMIAMGAFLLVVLGTLATMYFFLFVPEKKNEKDN
jgi:uncharacterized membrane protein